MFFKYSNWYLSNMFPCEVRTNRYVFKCVESAFQACKCPERVEEFINLNGYEAKKLGKQVQLRPDWEQVKDKYMYNLVKRKFDQNAHLRHRLMFETSGLITEDNTWNDTYWGVCRGKGQNKLGIILTNIRDSYLEEHHDLYELLRQRQ